MTRSWVRVLRIARWGERGAALVIVLLFMVVALILITAVLAVTGNEIQIAGLHRDSVRALELAHAGLAEGVQRVVEHDLAPGTGICPAGFVAFSPSVLPVLQAGESLTAGVCRRHEDDEIAVYEVQADATVGRAVRRLSQIVKILRGVLPDIVYARDLLTYGAGRVPQGDIYAWGPVNLKNNPGTMPPGNVFAGWYVRPVSPDRPACYNPYRADGTREPLCTDPDPDPDTWFPGRRHAVRVTDADGQDILANTCQTYNPAAEGNNCPPATSWTRVQSTLNAAIGGGNMTLTVADASRFGVSGVVVIDSEEIAFAGRSGNTLTGLTRGAGGTAAAAHFVSAAVYLWGPTCAVPAVGGVPISEMGVQAENRNQPANPAGPDPADEIIVSSGFDLDTDAAGVHNARTAGRPCGFPYKYIPDTIEGEKRYYKTIIYDQWREIYYTDEGAKKPAFESNPQFAAIPPFPTTAFFDSLYARADDRRGPPGGNLNSGSGISIGCPPLWDPTWNTVCIPPATTPGTSRIVYLSGNWSFEGNLAGYGILVIDGDLDVRGTIDYTGKIFVLGKVRGNGTAKITGGLIVEELGSQMGGTLELITGDDPGDPARAERTPVIGAMWER